MQLTSAVPFFLIYEIGQSGIFHKIRFGKHFSSRMNFISMEIG